MLKPKVLLYLLIFLEVLLFIAVCRVVGVFAALLLIILGSIVGFVLLRISGAAILQTMQAQMKLGRPPLFNASDSLLMLAGILLIIPGFFTDILAIMCLIPGFSKYLSQLLLHWNVLAKKTDIPANDSHIIEGEFERKDEDSK